MDFLKRQIWPYALSKFLGPSWCPHIDHILRGEFMIFQLLNSPNPWTFEGKKWKIVQLNDENGKKKMNNRINVIDIQ